MSSAASTVDVEHGDAAASVGSSRTQIASPIPLPPPVTTATRPSSARPLIATYPSVCRAPFERGEEAVDLGLADLGR